MQNLQKLRNGFEMYWNNILVHSFRFLSREKRESRIKCKSTEQPVKSRDIYAKDSSYVTIEEFEKMKAELSQTIEQQKTDIKKTQR